MDDPLRLGDDPLGIDDDPLWLYVDRLGIEVDPGKLRFNPLGLRGVRMRINVTPRWSGVALLLVDLVPGVKRVRFVSVAWSYGLQFFALVSLLGGVDTMLLGIVSLLGGVVSVLGDTKCILGETFVENERQLVLFRCLGC